MVWAVAKFSKHSPTSIVKDKFKCAFFFMETGQERNSHHVIMLIAYIYGQPVYNDINYQKPYSKLLPSFQLIE